LVFGHPVEGLLVEALDNLCPPYVNCVDGDTPELFVGDKSVGDSDGLFGRYLRPEEIKSLVFPLVARDVRRRQVEVF
jgi:hypothetical protein